MVLSSGLSRVLCLGALATLASVGCARGGGDERDSGRLPMLDGGRDAAVLRVDAGPGADGGPDLGIDSSVPDGGSIRIDSGPIGIDSGPVGCTSAAECSNGLACDGIERCEANRCVPGTRVACDDGVPCTTDACVEPGSCAYTTVDSLCAPGQRCTATGCMTTGTCTESPCRLVAPQCGCAAGQGCYLTGSTRACAPSGSGIESSGCTTSSTCGASLDCINYSAITGTPSNQCARYCGTDADCTAGAGSLCVQTLNDGTGGTVPGVRLCSHACDPVTASGCAAGLYCALFQETAGAARVYTECLGPAGVGTQNASCFDETDCARGFACLDAGFGTECLRWCRVGSACSGGLTCYGFTTPLVLGGVQYGVCDF